DLCGTIELDSRLAFGGADLLQVPYDVLIERMLQWQSAPDKLAPWITYHLRHRRLVELGIAPLAERLQLGQLPAEAAESQLELAFFETLLREVFRCHPKLARFHGAGHEQLRSRFCELDEVRIALARQEVADAHFRRLP